MNREEDLTWTISRWKSPPPQKKTASQIQDQDNRLGSESGLWDSREREPNDFEHYPLA